MILPCIDGTTPFPPINQALNDPDGLLCFGGDLSSHRLTQAYNKGIFPWYSLGEPILWWSPSERMVMRPNEFHVSKSLKKAINQLAPQFHFNRNFKSTAEHCAQVRRKDKGTWIHPEMIAAYTALFNEGHAFCLEVEIDGALAGGIYGVALGAIYCGESMFSLQTNGSKMAMYGLCQHMLKNGIKLLDCQLHNPHLASLGAKLIPRTDFIKQLNQWAAV